MARQSSPRFPELATTLQKAGKRQDWTKRRRANIEWLQRLDRQGLAYGKLERRILMRCTPSGEKIYFQYPGKESALLKANGSKALSPKPWDARPKLLLPDGTTIKDLSFGELWRQVRAVLEVSEDAQEDAAILATVFYRMAFMLDHRPSDGPTSPEHYECDKEGNFLRSVKEATGPFEIYSPPPNVLKHFEPHFNTVGGPSMEAYLVYNDLLAWNEDSKYFGHESPAKRQKREAAGLAKQDPRDSWSANQAGRVNTCLSHVGVLGYHRGIYTVEDLLGIGALTGGVYAPKPEVALKICAPYLRGPPAVATLELD